MAGDKVELEGLVVAEKGAGHFTIELEGGKQVIASISGRMREKRIRVIVGDKVKVSFSPYDLNRGQITYRHRL